MTTTASDATATDSGVTTTTSDATTATGDGTTTDAEGTTAGDGTTGTDVTTAEPTDGPEATATKQRVLDAMAGVGTYRIGLSTNRTLLANGVRQSASVESAVVFDRDGAGPGE